MPACAAGDLPPYFGIIAVCCWQAAAMLWYLVVALCLLSKAAHLAPSFDGTAARRPLPCTHALMNSWAPVLCRGSSNVLGRMELRWSGMQAEAGRLQTQPILGGSCTLTCAAGVQAGDPGSSCLSPCSHLHHQRVACTDAAQYCPVGTHQAPRPLHSMHIAS